MPASSYPITQAVGIIDKKKSIVILTERAQGATAKPKNGRIEIFITRKTIRSDYGGMGGMVNKFHELACEFKMMFGSDLDIKQLYQKIIPQSVLL